MVKKLKSIQEPDGSGTLFDNTLVVWTRDFGDADAHNSRNMKFVLAQGNGGYLKTGPDRPLHQGVAGNNRKERILLNLAEAMGVTDFDRLRRPGRRLQAEQDPAQRAAHLAGNR